MHDITSPIEQIFLMEWRLLQVDERYGLKIRPQGTSTVNGTTYKIDFVVETPNGEMKLAIELDGHDFHEKTKEQAACDRQRCAIAKVTRSSASPAPKCSAIRESASRK